ncbi:hypothetical protein [Candidatus Phytoplasma pruni]|nr:hypothetical protein [Candidatus Phytoplasma pruni]
MTTEITEGKSSLTDKNDKLLNTINKLYKNKKIYETDMKDLFI